MKDISSLYDLAFRQMTDRAVFLIDLEGRNASWNLGVGNLLGYSEAEWIGLDAAVIFTREDRESGESDKELSTARSEGKAADVRWHVRKDGSRVFADGLLQAVRDADGTLIGFLKIMMDATDRQLATERLNEILESISDAFYAVDAEFRFTYVNRVAEQWWKRNRDELIGRRIWTEFPQALNSESHRMHLKAMKGRRPVRYETISPVLGRWLDVSVYPDKRGGLSCYFRDAEERKQNEQKLRQLTEGLNLAQVMVRSTSGVIEYWSAGSEKLYGFTREEAVGQVCFDLLQTQLPDSREAIEKQLYAAGAWKGEVRHCRKDGSCVVVATDWVVHRDDAGQVRSIIESSSDITGLKQSQEEVMRAMADLYRANEELSQFSHIVSHDLQAPLRMVRSYAELLARRFEGKNDLTANHFLRFILQGAHGMDALIRTLLEYAQTANQPVTKGPVWLAAVMDAVLMNLQPEIEETHAEVTYGEMPTVGADPVQIQQLLQNLIGNALKYRRPDTKLRISVTAERHGSEWIVSVEDNGMGIDPRDLQRIFQPLRRLHGSEIPGTGIGLAVCKKIVERHGGRIWVESEPGKGSVFSIALPGE